MKLALAAVILFCSITTGFAGNFTPIPKNKVAQRRSANCQFAFLLCLQVCGSGCQSLRSDRPAGSRNAAYYLPCGLIQPTLCSAACCCRSQISQESGRLSFGFFVLGDTAL